LERAFFVEEEVFDPEPDFFVLPPLEPVVVDAFCVEVELPGVVLWVWLHETQSAPAATKATIDRSDFFIGLFELTSAKTAEPGERRQALYSRWLRRPPAGQRGTSCPVAPP
jgi:hypothetical protein